MVRKTSEKFTEEFNRKYNYQPFKKPKWNNKVIDFQFFFKDEPELEHIPKIEIS